MLNRLIDNTIDGLHHHITLPVQNKSKNLGFGHINSCKNVPLTQTESKTSTSPIKSVLASSSHQSRTTTKTFTVTPLLKELPPPTNSILNQRPPTINLQWLLPMPYLLPAVLPSKYTRNYYAAQLPVTRTSGLHCFAGQSDSARSCCGYSHTVIMAQSMDLYSQKTTSSSSYLTVNILSIYAHHQHCLSLLH